MARILGARQAGPPAEVTVHLPDLLVQLPPERRGSDCFLPRKRVLAKGFATAEIVAESHDGEPGSVILTLRVTDAKYVPEPWCRSAERSIVEQANERLRPNEAP